MRINLRVDQKNRERCKRFEKGPSEYNSVEFGPDRLQQLRVEEVLTQAEGAPVTSAHAAQPGVAEKTYKEDKHQHKIHRWTQKKSQIRD